MNETKRKILSHSLKLFNDRGISNVALRTIADEAGISVGNLQYHFKKREDIMESLYFQIVEKIGATLVFDEKNLFRSFFNSSKQMITILFEYHFFLLDFVTIVRNNEKIKKHYSELSEQRENQFLMIVAVLIEQGLFRQESLTGEYKTLFQRTEVISNFWFSSILIQETTLPKKTVDDYAFVVSQSIYPYLTSKGQKEYEKIFPDQMI